MKILLITVFYIFVFIFETFSQKDPAKDFFIKVKTDSFIHHRFDKGRFFAGGTPHGGFSFGNRTTTEGKTTPYDAQISLDQEFGYFLFNKTLLFVDWRHSYTKYFPKESGAPKVWYTNHSAALGMRCFFARTNFSFYAQADAEYGLYYYELEYYTQLPPKLIQLSVVNFGVGIVKRISFFDFLLGFSYRQLFWYNDSEYMKYDDGLYSKGLNFTIGTYITFK